MSVVENIAYFKKQLSGNVKLVAVSKTHPVGLIQEAYDGGQRIFGENKVQEMEQKHDLLPKDIEWHMIGHLQTNKVKYIASFVSLIHGVDSLKLLNIINAEGEKAKRIIPCLLQIHIAKEETKFGFSVDEILQLANGSTFNSLKNVEIRGVMGMATFTSDEAIVRNEFKTLKNSFDQLKSSYFSNQPAFCEISMGMSDDYRIAVEEGSTMVRIGSAIFGDRIYR
jgi:PLP dependent protein